MNDMLHWWDHLCIFYNEWVDTFLCMPMLNNIDTLVIIQMGVHESVRRLMSSGPASANRYEAIFSGGGIGGAPGWAGLFGINRVRELNDHSKLLITNIIFPGRAYTTGNIRGDRAVGVTRKYITSVMFNEFQMTYTLTADMAVHDLYNQCQ